MKKILIFFSASIILFASFWFYLDRNYEIPILMYHSLNKSKMSEYPVVQPQNFHQQMNFIKRNGYRVIPFNQYCQLLKDSKPVPRKTVVITFDDGLKDNLKAINILDEFGYPATIFMIVDKIGKDNYLAKSDINFFLADTEIEIGSHTLSHAYLPDLDDVLLRREILRSKSLLERRFFQNIEIISYPIGGFDERVVEEVEKGEYLCACTTNRGFSRGLNRFALRRIKITNRDLGFRLWAKLSGFYNIFKKPKKPY